jgi:hypothetical protein
MATTRSKRKQQTNGRGERLRVERSTLAELRRHARVLREISRETKRVERLREKAKGDLLDFGIKLANQAGWHVSKSDPAATADRSV